jgi:tetratricopeptide (TPR) repeat protein
MVISPTPNPALLCSPTHQTFEEALARAHQSGDAACISFVANWAAIYYGSRAELERAAQVALEAVEMARSIGDRHQETTALDGLGLTYSQLGLYDMAKETLHTAMKRHEALGNRSQYAFAGLHLGHVLLRLGEATGAKALLERLETEVVAGERLSHATCSLYLAYTAEEMGDGETAVRRAQAGHDLLSQIGVKGLEMECEAILARRALAQGRLDEAASSNVRAVIEFSYQALMEYAERISNSEWRKAFLENCPEHGILIQRWHDLHAKLAFPNT